MKKLLVVVASFSIFFLIGCTAKPDYISELTAPITYSLATNAIKADLENFTVDLKISGSNLKLAETGWPKGEILYDVSSELYKGKKAQVRYVLNGSPIATAIIDIEKQDKEQVNINLYERAKILGQAITVESLIKTMSDNLCKKIGKDLKVAVIDFAGIADQKYSLGIWISESFIHYATENEIKIVERRLIEKLIKEVEFSNSAIAAIDTRKKIGEILGADIIVNGTIKIEKEEVIVNARAIRIVDGVIISTAQSVIPIYLLGNWDITPSK